MAVLNLALPRGMGWGGWWEEGSGWGAHVSPWLIHVSVWPKPLQYCEVISLQLIKVNEKKKKKVKQNKTKQKKPGSLGDRMWGRKDSKTVPLHAVSFNFFASILRTRIFKTKDNDLHHWKRWWVPSLRLSLAIWDEHPLLLSSVSEYWVKNLKITVLFFCFCL